jgi:hypothetical protein
MRELVMGESEPEIVIRVFFAKRFGGVKAHPDREITIDMQLRVQTSKE